MAFGGVRFTPAASCNSAQRESILQQRFDELPVCDVVAESPVDKNQRRTTAAGRIGNGYSV
jgi:hypothetical protein